jgi:Transglycosylase SLT domain
MASYDWLSALAGIAEGAQRVQENMTNQSKLEYDLRKDQGIWEPSERPGGVKGFFDALFGYSPPGTISLGGNRYTFKPHKAMTAEDLQELGLVTPERTLPGGTLPLGTFGPTPSPDVIKSTLAPANMAANPFQRLSPTAPLGTPGIVQPEARTGGKPYGAFLGARLGPKEVQALTLELLKERYKRESDEALVRSVAEIYQRRGQGGERSVNPSIRVDRTLGTPTQPPAGILTRPPGGTITQGPLVTEEATPPATGQPPAGQVPVGQAPAAQTPAGQAPTGQPPATTQPPAGTSPGGLGKPGSGAKVVPTTWQYPTDPPPPPSSAVFPTAGTVAQRKAWVDQRIDTYAPYFKVNPKLAKIVAGLENQQYDPTVASDQDAVGIMGLKKDAATQMRVTDRTDPEQNVRGGMAYLSWLESQFPGRLDLQLAAYNAGPQTVKDAGNAVPKNPETIAYVHKSLQSLGLTMEDARRGKGAAPVTGGAPPAPGTTGTGTAGTTPGQPTTGAPGGRTTVAVGPQGQGATGPTAQVTTGAPAQTPPGTPEQVTILSDEEVLKRMPPDIRNEYERNVEAIEDNQIIAEKQGRLESELEVRRRGLGAFPRREAQRAQMEVTRLQTRNAKLLDDVRGAAQRKQEEEEKAQRAPKTAADVKSATQAVEVPEDLKTQTELMHANKEISSSDFNKLDPAERPIVRQRLIKYKQDVETLEKAGPYVGNATRQLMLEQDIPMGKLTGELLEQGRQRGIARKFEDDKKEELAKQIAKAGGPLGTTAGDYHNFDETKPLHPDATDLYADARKDGYFFLKKPEADTLRQVRTGQNQIENIDVFLHGGLDVEGRFTTAGTYFPGIHRLLDEESNPDLKNQRALATRARRTFDVYKAIVGGKQVGEWIIQYQDMKAATLAAFGRNLGEDRGHFSDADADRAALFLKDLTFKNGRLALSESASRFNMSSLYGMLNDKMTAVLNRPKSAAYPWRAALDDRKKQSEALEKQWLAQRKKGEEVPPPTMGGTKQPAPGAPTRPQGSPAPAAPAPAAPQPPTAPATGGTTGQAISPPDQANLTRLFTSAADKLFPGRDPMTLTEDEMAQVKQRARTQWEEEQQRGRR